MIVLSGSNPPADAPIAIMLGLFASDFTIRPELIQKSTYSGKSLGSRTILRLHIQRFLILAFCPKPVALGFESTAEIHVREVVARIAGRTKCFLEPWDGVIGFALLQ